MSVRAEDRAQSSRAARVPARVRCRECRLFVPPTTAMCPRCDAAEPALPEYRPALKVVPAAAPTRRPRVPIQVFVGAYLWAIGAGLVATACTVIPWLRSVRAGHDVEWSFWKVRAVFERGVGADRIVFGYVRVLGPVLAVILAIWLVQALRRRAGMAWALLPLSGLGVVGYALTRLDDATWGGSTHFGTHVRLAPGPIAAAAGLALLASGMVLAATRRRGVAPAAPTKI
jgi:hypothetical protein